MEHEIAIFYNGTDSEYKKIKNICSEHNGEWVGIEDEIVVFGFDNENAMSDACNHLGKNDYDMDIL